MEINSTTKSTVKLFSPLFAGCGVAYYLWKRGKSKPKELVIFSLIVAAVAWFVASQIMYLISKLPPPNPKDPPNDNNINGSDPFFNPKPITDGLYEDIDYWLFFSGNRNADPYNQLAALSDINLLGVYKDWNSRYYSKRSQTLVQAMQGEYYAFGSLSGTVTDILARYSKLNAK